MALYVNGKKAVNSLVIDGNAYDKAVILDQSETTTAWVSPLVYNSVNVLEYEALCFTGTDQGNAFRVYFNIADLTISQNPGAGEDYNQFSQNGYLYVDPDGYLYYYVSTGKTLILTSIIVYKASDNSGGGSGVDYLESWIISNSSTTNVSHIEYNTDGIITDFINYPQPGNTTRVLGDVSTYIGASSNWLWQVTATADMTYRIFDVVNNTVTELRTATANTVILNNIPSSGDYIYEIRRYS